MHDKSQTNGYPLRHNLTPVLVRIDQLKPLGRETRRHPNSQIDQLAASIDAYGFAGVIVADTSAGWWPAARYSKPENDPNTLIGKIENP